MESNWLLSAVVGAAIGYLLPYFIRTFGFLSRRLKKDIVKGKWYVYHPSNRDTGFLIEESVFNIKTGFFHKYTIREYKSKNILIAKGTLSFERNYWLIELNGIIHKEKVAIRLFAPIATTESMTWGFFQSMDYLGNPIVGPIIFSRTVLSSEDVKSEFTRKVKAVRDYNILTAKK